MADARVVAGGQAIGADLASHAKEGLKLHVGVAVGAGDGSAPAEIVVYEGSDDALFKLLLEVDDVVREIQMLRDALGVVDIVEGAATVLRWPICLELGQPALIPELHGKADDGPSLPLENGGNCGRVHTTGHGDGNQTSLKIDARQIG